MRPIAPEPQSWLRTVIFDLDETLLLRGRAWRYALEQAVLIETGVRVDASALETEYRTRPWRHALAIVVPEPSAIGRCEARCQELYARSAMKHLLVHDGIGMALDLLRGARIEMAAISREPHRLALSQMESTGLDRFLSMLASTPSGERWAPETRGQECIAFFGRSPDVAAFVSADAHDMAAVAGLGIATAAAGWAVAGTEALAGRTLAHPSELARLAATLTPGRR